MYRHFALLALTLAAGSVHANDTELALGKRLFTQGATPPCAVCHTLKDAGATGEVGPVLDELKPDEQRVSTVVRTGLGVMPAFGTLSEAEVKAIARYVASVAGR